MRRAQVADDRCQQEAAADQVHRVTSAQRFRCHRTGQMHELLSFYFFVSRFLLYRKYRCDISGITTKVIYEAALSWVSAMCA